MEPIASRSNPRIKQVKRLQSDRRFRRREGLFVIETNRWLSEALAQDQQPTLVLHTPDWAATADGRALLAACTGKVVPLTPGVLREVSETQRPAGFLALLPIPEPTAPAKPTLLLILDQLRDPGNLGTLIRTASAAGVDAIILTPGTVDPYNPKVVRATMGALLRVPLLELEWPAVAALAQGLTLYGATGEAATHYDEIDWTDPAGLIVGGEATGLSPAAQMLVAQTLKIEMANGVESLNAALAGGIILFEAARQRRRRG